MGIQIHGDKCSNRVTRNMKNWSQMLDNLRLVQHNHLFSNFKTDRIMETMRQAVVRWRKQKQPNKSNRQLARIQSPSSWKYPRKSESSHCEWAEKPDARTKTNCHRDKAAQVQQWREDKNTQEGKPTKTHQERLCRHRTQLKPSEPPGSGSPRGMNSGFPRDARSNSHIMNITR